MAVDAKTRESQFAAICGKDWPGLMVLAFSFPSEGAQAAVHYELMERRFPYRLYDGTGSQLHIVLRKENEAELRQIIARHEGTERQPWMGKLGKDAAGR